MNIYFFINILFQTFHNFSTPFLRSQSTLSELMPEFERHMFEKNFFLHIVFNAK